MMSDNVFETSEDGRFRVQIVRDEHPQEPDWDDPSWSEVCAWREGEVYGWVVERRVTWAPIDTPADEDVTMQTWAFVDSCWGYYGDTEYLHDSAREALRYASGEAG